MNPRSLVSSLNRPGKGRKGGPLHAVLYILLLLSAASLFISHGNVTLRAQLGQLQMEDAARFLSSGGWGLSQSPPQHEPRYLLDTAWSSDPMLGQIKTDLYLSHDIRVHVMPPKPDFDPFEGNLVDYLMVGLIEHPRVVLVDDKEDADVIFSIAAWTNDSATLGHGEEMANNPYWSRVVIVDEVDHPDSTYHGIYDEGRYLAYFKRSFVPKNYSDASKIDRTTGERDLSYSYWTKRHNMFGFAYGVTDRYLQSLWDETNLLSHDDGSNRTIPVLCTIRHNTLTEMGARINIKTWLQEMEDVPGIQVAESDTHSRGDTGQAYWEALKKAKIVAHANPGNWEGDFRLWESLASKALVFVDYMYTTLPHPLIDGEDVVFYDPHDKQAFVDKVKYYLDHPEEARRIAMNGFRTAIRHHRYVNRVDYILTTADLLTDPAYQNSAMHLKEQMMRAQKHFFRPKSERELLFANHTMAHTARDLAEKPSAATIASLKGRVAARRQEWIDWIYRKKVEMPT